ncbi:helix-turn-helix domain-containing protein, partial [Pseudomonas aeruginosa]|uniref:helix-turn-helix domain-containing protein n=1 Tax=Pseudomonas aeruginosa TaxID=287 RepID=UPI0015B86770
RSLRVHAYPRIARRARELMVEKIGESLSISDICQSIGCSRRALQYAFESVFDVKPLTYLRLLRLERVHKLLQSQPDATVQDSAEAFGFHHLPRFAQHYMTVYGELPSQTLSKHKRAATMRFA